MRREAIVNAPAKLQAIVWFPFTAQLRAQGLRIS